MWRDLVALTFSVLLSRRRRHGKPVRWSDARTSRFLGDPRVQVGGLSRGRPVDHASTSLPRHPAVHRLITERAGKDVSLLVAGQAFPNDLDRQIGQRMLDHAALLDPLERDIKTRVLAIEVEQLGAVRAE